MRDAEVLGDELAGLVAPAGALRQPSGVGDEVAVVQRQPDQAQHHEEQPHDGRHEAVGAQRGAQVLGQVVRHVPDGTGGPEEGSCSAPSSRPARVTSRT